MVRTRRQIKSANDEVPINASVASSSGSPLLSSNLSSNTNPSSSATDNKLMEENRRLNKTVQNLQNSLSKLKNEKEEAQKRYEDMSKLMEAVVVQRRMEESKFKDAITIFPEEIWLKIIESLKDWKDLWNLSKTCLLFHKLLHPSKTTFLFSQIFPLLWKEQTGSDILKCRTVCATWRKEIDQFLENRPCLRPHNGRRCKAQELPFLNPMKIKGLGLGYTFDSTTVERWAARNEILQGWTIGDQSQSPLIGRALSIKFTPTGDLRDLSFFEGLTNFLTAVGKHIWYISVHLESRPEAFIVACVQHLLTNNLSDSVPELRKLRIIGNLAEYPMLPCPMTTWASNSLESLEVEKALTYPRDPTGLLHSHPHLMLDGYLRQRHTQLKKLHIDMSAWSRVRHLGWPNLVELQVMDTIHHPDDDGENKFHVRMMGLGTPKLKKLGVYCAAWELHIKSRNRPDSFGANRDLHKLLDILRTEVGYQQLESLRITGNFQNAKRIEYHSSDEEGDDEEGHPHEHKCFRIMPATLKTLELEYFPQSCYSFLRRFVFLENLSLVWKELDGLNLDWSYITSLPQQPYPYLPMQVGQGFRVERELHEFVASGQMYKSNVWTMLPRLKVLTLQWKVYTREGYEEYTKKHARPEVGRRFE